MKKKITTNKQIKILPEGKTKIPAEAVINKLGSSIILKVEVNLNKLLAEQK